MRSPRAILLLIPVVLVAALAGCPGASSSSGYPSFSLAWSEYPSWSVFGVAHEKGLINGEQGKIGPLEEKWKVDIVLKQADYDPCLTMYSSSTCDAVCITNMDVLNPSLSRKSVAILPTSTSDGADALLVVGIKDVDELKKHKVYGLEKSVSQYCFARCLQKLGKKDDEIKQYQFTNMDPAAAAAAMQTKQATHKAIMVWNPFVLQTLKTNTDAKVLFDSTAIKGEIIDMVVVAQSSLDKPGGKDFAYAVIDTYYELNKKLADPKTGDETLVALGAKFSSLNLEEMKQVVQQTKFYKTPEEGLGVFNGDDLPKVMTLVTDFCVANDIVKSKPKIGYGAGKGGDAQLHFDPSYIQEVQKKK